MLIDRQESALIDWQESALIDWQKSALIELNAWKFGQPNPFFDVTLKVIQIYILSL